MGIHDDTRQLDLSCIRTEQIVEVLRHPTTGFPRMRCGDGVDVYVELVAAQRLEELQRKLVEVRQQQPAYKAIATLLDERDGLAEQRDASYAILRRLIESNGEQDYGIVAAARELLGMPESRLNPNPDDEHYHE
jgi:hypothetical protein